MQSDLSKVPGLLCSPQHPLAPGWWLEFAGAQQGCTVLQNGAFPICYSDSQSSLAAYSEVPRLSGRNGLPVGIPCLLDEHFKYFVWLRTLLFRQKQTQIQRGFAETPATCLHDPYV